MACHIVVTAVAYSHIVTVMFATNVYYLMLVTASVYNDAVVKRFKIIERSNQVSPKVLETSHEQVMQITARLHGLFWLFIPGAALLAKMCEYLNESVAILIFKDVKEVQKREHLPAPEMTDVLPAEFDKWPLESEERMQTVTIVDSESSTPSQDSLQNPTRATFGSSPSVRHVHFTKIHADGKTYSVSKVYADADESGNDIGNCVISYSQTMPQTVKVQATLDAFDSRSSARVSINDQVGRPVEFELNVLGNSIAVRNVHFFYRECRTGQQSFNIDRGVLASSVNWVLGLIKFIFFFLAWVALTHDQSYFAAQTALKFITIPIALVTAVKRTTVIWMKVSGFRDLMTLIKTLKGGDKKIPQIRKLLATFDNFGRKINGPFLKSTELITAVSKLPPTQKELWPQLLGESLHSLSVFNYQCSITDDAAKYCEALNDMFEATGFVFEPPKVSSIPISVTPDGGNSTSPTSAPAASEELVIAESAKAIAEPVEHEDMASSIAHAVGDLSHRMNEGLRRMSQLVTPATISEEGRDEGEDDPPGAERKVEDVEKAISSKTRKFQASELEEDEVNERGSIVEKEEPIIFVTAVRKVPEKPGAALEA